MDSIQEGANYADESEEEASSDTISDCWSYDYGLAAGVCDVYFEGRLPQNLHTPFFPANNIEPTRFLSLVRRLARPVVQ